MDYRSGLLAIYFFQIIPGLDRANQCNKPNALFIGLYDGRNIYCIDTKVADGLIFDSITLSPIKTDTIGAGQSFYCQCGQNISYSIWKRGTIIEDNPPSNPNVKLIFATPTSSNSSQQALIYKTYYNNPDNLYCITECPVNSQNYQYQFLKIR